MNRGWALSGRSDWCNSFCLVDLSVGSRLYICCLFAYAALEVGMTIVPACFIPNRCDQGYEKSPVQVYEGRVTRVHAKMRLRRVV